MLCHRGGVGGSRGGQVGRLMRLMCFFHSCFLVGGLEFSTFFSWSFEIEKTDIGEDSKLVRIGAGRRHEVWREKQDM